MDLDLEALWKRAGAAAWGTCAYRDLLPSMGGPAREKAEAICPAPAGAFVAAFPYYAGEEPGNLSLYARGEDYHLALSRRLEQVCAGLREAWPGRTFAPLVDDSPLPEREAAALAGLGLRGRNGLAILPPWGTWAFLGTVLTDLPLPSAPVPAPDCPDCGACAAACPGGALGPEGVDQERCLSALTQRKGELSPEQEALLAAHPLVWGCDACQRACPFSREAAVTPLPEFRRDLVAALSPSDVEGLTRRQFQAAFPGRAFTWRGPGVLSRNFALQQKRENR